MPDRAGAAAGGGPSASIEARSIILTGHVQGVGFRPFVYRIACELGLRGWVQNQLGQVAAHVQGTPEAVRAFERGVIGQAPPLSAPVLTQSEAVEAGAFDDFRIVASSESSEARVFVPPDYFTCPDCLRELADPGDRRHAYPFINCTQCGPRYTLITRMPYDRPNTSMAGFPLCPDCLKEYEDPLDRRFHAEPVACPVCGPQLEYLQDATCTRSSEKALTQAVAALRAGQVLAVKGVGGYHLMCDARNRQAVARLRARKHRPDKPLAVMFPAVAGDPLAGEVQPDDAETGLLHGPVRPIVLCRKAPGCSLADNVAPGLSEIGVFLPYSPLHHLLLQQFGGPLVATSGNLSGEPVLTANDDVENRLAGVADARLHHNRPIVRPADDPVYRSIAGVPRPIRLGRGCTPLEINLPWRQTRPVIAVGAHMKNAVALSWDDRAVVSPHIGEMDTVRSLEVFEQVLASLQQLYGIEAVSVVCDAHPGYTTSRWARESGLPVTRVLHHHAHASALAGEFGGGDGWLVFTWDGVGYGADGSLWGGEAFAGGAGHWQHAATMRPFHLPGGERAGREPWRSAAALCWETGQAWTGFQGPDALAHRAWQRRINAPQSSAAGRLFDAAAALILGIEKTSFEAQGPMQLEALAGRAGKAMRLPLTARDDGVLVTDWEPLLGMLSDSKLDQTTRARDFHATMAAALVDQARALCQQHEVKQVGLAGGVFQNRVLTEAAVAKLEAAGFRVRLGEMLPANDAAIAFGQTVERAALSAQGAD